MCHKTYFGILHHTIIQQYLLFILHFVHFDPIKILYDLFKLLFPICHRLYVGLLSNIWIPLLNTLIFLLPSVNSWLTLIKINLNSGLAINQ